MTDLASQVRLRPEPVLGASWATKRPMGAGARRAQSRLRERCPVCGHPTTDCTHDTPGGQPHG